MKISAVAVVVAITVACIVQALPISVDQAVIVKRGAVSTPSTNDWLENSHSKLGANETLERRGWIGSMFEKGFKLFPKGKPPTTLPKSETLANPIGHVGNPVGRGANTVEHALNPVGRAAGRTGAGANTVGRALDPVGRAAGRTGAGANTVEHVTIRPVLRAPDGVKYVMPPVKVGRGGKLVPSRMNREPGNPYPRGVVLPRGSSRPPVQTFSASLKSVLGSIKGIFKKPKDPAAKPVTQIGNVRLDKDFLNMELKDKKLHLAGLETQYGKNSPLLAHERKIIEQEEAKSVKAATKGKT